MPSLTRVIETKQNLQFKAAAVRSHREMVRSIRNNSFSLKNTNFPIREDLDQFVWQGHVHSNTLLVYAIRQVSVRSKNKADITACQCT